MAEISDLRAIIQSRVARYEDDLVKAQEEVEAAQRAYEAAKRALIEVTEEAAKSLEAICRVEYLLEDANRAEKAQPYRGLNQEDAMRLVLSAAQRPLPAADLAEALKDGGYQFTSANPANSIGVAANANRKGYFTTEKEGHRTLIGLKQWVALEVEDDFSDWLGGAQTGS